LRFAIWILWSTVWHLVPLSDMEAEIGIGEGDGNSAAELGVRFVGRSSQSSTPSVRRSERVPQVSDQQQREAEDSTHEIKIVACAAGKAPAHPRK